MRQETFEDSTVGAPTPEPKAPHEFQLRSVVTQVSESTMSATSGMFCIKCGKRMNEVGEVCTGKRA